MRKNHMARLLNLMHAFRAEGVIGSLSPEGERILSFVSERASLELSTTVSDVVASRLFGTAPTVQRRVNELAGHGWIVFSKKSHDLRKQNISLSDSAEEYMKQLEVIVVAEMCKS